jgi:hypothetical protein
MNWQTPAAIGIVFIALFFLVRGSAKKKGCGGSCDCGKDEGSQKKSERICL